MSSVTSKPGSKIDRQAVLDVLKGVYDAWEANDAEAFVSDYLEDASVVQPGVYEKDRHEIQTTIGAAFAGPLKGSRVINDPVDVRFLNDSAAIHFDFTDDADEWKGTEIRFDILRNGSKTELRFTHVELVPAYECFEVCSGAWDFYLQTSMRGLIRTGRGLPNPLEQPAR